MTSSLLVRVGALVVLSLSIAGASLAACTSSSVAPACAALLNCCELGSFAINSSSCSETTMSGQTDAECGEQLETYRMNGECPVDGGAGSGDSAGDSGNDAGAAADAKK